MHARWGLIVALVLGSMMGIYATIPPAAKPAHAPLEQFSAGRAMADVRVSRPVRTPPAAPKMPKCAAICCCG